MLILVPFTGPPALTCFWRPFHWRGSRFLSQQVVTKHEGCSEGGRWDLSARSGAWRRAAWAFPLSSGL